MNEDQLRDIVSHPRHISGIHNYCDRWCERCPKTWYCSVFAMEQAEKQASPETDTANEDYWKTVGNFLQLALDMVQNRLDEEGMALSEEDMAASMEASEKKRQASAQHPCATLARDYLDKSMDWLEENEALAAKADELKLQERLDLPDTDPGGDAAALENALEVIRWYQTLIHVKLRRAVDGLLEPCIWEDDEIQTDANGSAKVALIGIDRSLAAWGILLQALPQSQDAILPLLSQLRRLRLQAEQTFPFARAFKRPGFD